jgi:hypothetical protein
LVTASSGAHNTNKRPFTKWKLRSSYLPKKTPVSLAKLVPAAIRGEPGATISPMAAGQVVFFWFYSAEED